MRSASLRAGSPIRASEASREGQRKGAPPAFASPLACMSRVSFSRYPPDGELARRPTQCKTAVDLSWKHLHRNLCGRLFKLGRTRWSFEAKSHSPIIIHYSFLLLLYWNVQVWKRTILGTVNIPSAWFVSFSFLFHDFKKFPDWYQEIITSWQLVTDLRLQYFSIYRKFWWKHLNQRPYQRHATILRNFWMEIQKMKYTVLEIR